MATPPTKPDQVPSVPAGGFPPALRGYERASVDAYVHRVNERLAELARAVDDLEAETAELRAAGEPDVTARREAERIRADAIAEVERLHRAARSEGEALLAAAKREAATTEERGRQELAWRRRQIRREQELLERHKHAVVGQLASLGALAADAAVGLPEADPRSEQAVVGVVEAS